MKTSFRLFVYIQCSVTCGSGVRNRLVECSDEDFSCDARAKPLATERCELETCPQWTTGAWGKVK